MTPRYGSETTTEFTDDDGSSVSTVAKRHEGLVKKTFKRYCIRVKVHGKQDEMVQFLAFTDTIEQKHKEGLLITKDDDPQNMPSFMVEFPKFDMDGAYFIVRSHTELVL